MRCGFQIPVFWKSGNVELYAGVVQDRCSEVDSVYRVLSVHQAQERVVTSGTLSPSVGDATKRLWYYCSFSSRRYTALRDNCTSFAICAIGTPCDFN